jgi:hypothetical protein
LLQLVCALLLFAQQLSLAHAVFHAYKHLPAHEQSGVQTDRPDRPHAPKLSKLCEFDAVFGQVLGGAPPTTHFLSLLGASTETAARVRCGFVAVGSLAPRSRGPPSLL